MYCNRYLKKRYPLLWHRSLLRKNQEKPHKYSPWYSVLRRGGKKKPMPITDEENLRSCLLVKILVIKRKEILQKAYDKVYQLLSGTGTRPIIPHRRAWVRYPLELLPKQTHRAAVMPPAAVSLDAMWESRPEFLAPGQGRHLGSGLVPGSSVTC